MALVEIIDFAGKFKGRAVKIILNDPENLNAMSEKMAEEFSSAIASLKTKENIRAVVLTGNGNAFSAGGDLKMLQKKSKIPLIENQRLMLEFYKSFLSILDIKVPLIAAINGHAVGAGLCLASACDIRICSTKAKLGFTFTKIGLHPGMGATYFLPKLLGESVARELLLSGRMIEAKEAFEIGLVSKVVAAEEIDSECEKLIAEISAGGPKAISMLSETLRSSAVEDLNAALEREAICQAYSYAGEEFKEGIAAAIEKRAPNFK
jgi:enoyl-CoA hydratase/carnithine racemase